MKFGVFTIFDFMQSSRYASVRWLAFPLCRLISETFVVAVAWPALLILMPAQTIWGNGLSSLWRNFVEGYRIIYDAMRENRRQLPWIKPKEGGDQ